MKYNILVQNCQNPFQAIIRLKQKNKKKWHGPLSHWCREGKTLVVRPLKKTLLCVSYLSYYYFNINK